MSILLHFTFVPASMSEFLSPDINKRDDEWCGSLENRSRILLRIINGCRKALGDNYPISVKLNSADFQKGGFSAEDSSKVASMLSEAKIDLIINSSQSLKSCK